MCPQGNHAWPTSFISEDRHKGWTPQSLNHYRVRGDFNGQGTMYGMEKGHQELSDQILDRLRMQASSRRNFAVLCMRLMFRDEERVGTNIGGSKGRAKLDPSNSRLSAIYRYVIQMYQVPEEQQNQAIQECIIAIDLANRNFKYRGEMN